jgi:hypothetical protein
MSEKLDDDVTAVFDEEYVWLSDREFGKPGVYGIRLTPTACEKLVEYIRDCGLMEPTPDWRKLLEDLVERIRSGEFRYQHAEPTFAAAAIALEEHSE